MGTLKVIGSALYQWEIGRKIRVLSSVGDRAVMVQFAHPGDKEALSVTPREENGVIVADVPNILLQSGDKIVAFLVEVDANCVETTRHSVFHVVNRPKPADYIYTETEVLNYTYLDNRLKELEGDGLAKAVADYLKENPVQAGATAEEAAQIQQNKTDIEQLTQDKLDASKLPEAVNEALAQAKASGEFDGNDYVLTEADKTEIAEQAAEMVDVPEGNTAELFFAVYGETTYAEVTEALDDGKMVYVKYNKYLAPYMTMHSSSHWFRLVNEYDIGVTIQVDYNDEWNITTCVYTTNDTLNNYYNKNQVDDLLEGLDTGGSNQPLTFTGAVNATYDGSEAVSVEIPVGGGGVTPCGAEKIVDYTVDADGANAKSFTFTVEEYPKLAEYNHLRGIYRKTSNGSLPWVEVALNTTANRTEQRIGQVAAGSYSMGGFDITCNSGFYMGGMTGTVNPSVYPGEKGCNFWAITGGRVTPLYLEKLTMVTLGSYTTFLDEGGRIEIWGWND